MKDNIKTKFWIYFISFFIGNQIANIANSYLGFKGNEVFSLLFVKRIGISILCFISVYFLILGIKGIWEKNKSDKLILVIMIAFAVISIILIAISMIMPNFLHVYPSGFICFAIVNSVNGVKQIKGNNKTIGKLLISTSIFIYSVTLLIFYLSSP